LHGQPPLADLQIAIEAIGLKGYHTTWKIDNKHILMWFLNEEDFHMFWCREQWMIKRCPMRVFKWSPDFINEFESPLVPVWINLQFLTLHFNNNTTFFSIASNIGSHMQLDQATTLIRPPLGRLIVEVDVSEELPESIWSGASENNDCGYWQDIHYERVPAYCHTCFKLGHADHKCHITNP
jgi:hypothetical protein